MWKLIVPKETLLRHGFNYDNKEKRYIQDLGVFSDGGEVFINDNEDCFRIEMYCVETRDGEGDAYSPEHIADEEDYAMMDLEKAGVTIFIKDNTDKE